MPEPSPLLLNTREAARMLSISPRTIWSLQKSGEIHVVRLGRMIRFDVEDLKTLIAERKGPDNGAQKYANDNGRDANGRYQSALSARLEDERGTR